MASAKRQAERIKDSPGLVVVEIGSSDVLGGTSPETFEQELDVVLARLRSRKLTIRITTFSAQQPIRPDSASSGEVSQHGAGAGASLASRLDDQGRRWVRSIFHGKGAA